MTQGQIREFVDCMTYETNIVLLDEKLFWCLGVTHDADSGECKIEVWEGDMETREYKRNLLNFTGRSTEECMRHFLEDKYWDGQSFYDVAPRMEWF